MLELFLGLMVFLELVAPFVTKTYGIDARFHLLWIDQFSRLISEGVFIPTWVSSGFHGFGSSTFYFYPPVTYYVASGIHLLSGITQPTLLYQITSLLATIASFFTARVFLRSLNASRYQAMLGAALYAFAPVRMFELYNRGALASHLAYVFLPLVWMGLLQIVQNKVPIRGRRILLLAVSSALLALTSVGITLATAICIAIAASLQWKQCTRRVWIESAMAICLAASLVAYHYASALSALSFSRVSNLYYHHAAGDIWLWFHPGAGTYNLLLIYAMVGIIAVSYIVARRRKEYLVRVEQLTIQVGLSISVFVLFLDFSPLSAWLWNSPLFHLIQIPWRFYPQLLLFATVVVGIAYSGSLRLGAKAIIWLSALGLILPIAVVLSSWHSLDRPPAEDDAYAPRSSIPSDNLEAMILSHQQDPFALTDLHDGEEIRGIPGIPYSGKFNVAFQTVHSITFHRFYWPYWHLYVNGNEIPSRPDSIGRATAVLPAGRYSADWQLERTPLETAGLWISGIAWSGVVIFWGIGLARRHVRKKHPIVTA